MKTEWIKESIAGYWSQWSAGYDQQYAHSLKTEAETRAWLEMMAAAIGPEPSRVLDVGTGTGFLANLSSMLGHFGVGLDLSRDMLQLAADKNHEIKGGFEFLEGDAEALPFEDNSFDVVMNRHLLWTLPDPSGALAEWVRVVRPGGKVLIINGTWYTSGLKNHMAAFAGKCLIAVQERLNPWKSGYQDELGPYLPLMNGVSPGAIKKLMEKAGLEHISCLDMGSIVKEETAVMPFSYRLAYRHARAALCGRKSV